MAQAHNKFKVFIGANDVHVLSDASAFANGTESIAPKSLGIEYVDKADVYVLTLGYRDDDKYAVQFHEHDLGAFDFADPETPAKIAAAMEKAAAGIERVLCHEFFVTGKNEVIAVFMARVGKS